MKFKKHIVLAAFILARAGVALAQSTPGFVQEDVVKVAGVTTDAALYALPLSQRQSNKVYYDGMGRTLQAIAVQGSPLQNDLIQPVAYNNLGQQTNGYLPYAGQSTDNMGSYRQSAVTINQPAFYNQTSQYLIPVDSKPYNAQVFENSPLQRVLQAGMTGNGFQPGVSLNHWKTVNYRYNSATADGNILQWNADGTFTTGTYFADNTLSVTDGTDEDNVETLSFSDLAGRLMLKRQVLAAGSYLDTYYIYDNAGMLTWIVPPQATALLVPNSYNLTIAPLSNLIFNFIYDTKGRLVDKTVPGKGVVWIIYDPINRPVLVQDANMRLTHSWNYIKYDAKNRPVSQGIYVDIAHQQQSTMQGYVNSLLSSYTTAWFETRNSTAATGYYTTNIFPTTATGTITPLAYEYYDDYFLTQGASPDFSYVSQGLPNEETATTAQLKGMPTMLLKSSVGSGISTTIWLTTVTFYDHNLHPIQTQSNNHIFYNSTLNLTDNATTVPDFTGMPVVSQVIKKTGTSTTITVKTTMTYDHRYRVTAVDQNYNGGATVHVAAYSYNEVGQVIKKGLGYVNPTTWLQNVNLRYNIRGQLMNINNSKLANDGGVTSNETTDLFGMQLLYNIPDSNLTTNRYYNGKLSAVKWMSKDANGTSTYERAYSFHYDAVDRYTAENYAERTVISTGTFSNNLGGFDESGITYNQNGNILTLQRNSSIQGTNTHTQIDNLAYTYSTTNPNQLTKVTDGPGTQYTSAGFRNITGTTTGTYSYDTNGNLTADPFKGLTKITYNVLNRTDSIQLSATQYITYTYDASGTLIRKKAFKSGTATQQTDYLDGFVYNNSSGTEVLAYFAMPEGRVVNNAGTLTQEFIITDQQGNARISFKNNGSGTAVVTQETSYYGFGYQLPNSPVSPLPAIPNKQLYNGGSEWQNDYATNNLPDYYQTFNRNYDAAIGRFVAVDPVAESAESMTSYNYAGNNPIMMNDPTGSQSNTGHGGMLYGTNEPSPLVRFGSSSFDYSDYLNAEADEEMNSFLWDSIFQSVSNSILSYGGSSSVGNSGSISSVESLSINGTASGSTPSGAMSLRGSVTGQNLANEDNPKLVDNVYAIAKLYSGVDIGNWTYAQPLSGFTISPGVDILGTIQKEAYATDFYDYQSIGNQSSANAGKPLFGSTNTSELGLPQHLFGGLFGKFVLEATVTNYQGHVNDSRKGLFNLNLTQRNGKVEGEVSVDIGSFSYGFGLGSTSLTIGGYSINSKMSALGEFSFGYSYTDSNGHIQGTQIDITPQATIKLIPILVSTAPYWAPAL